MTKNKTIYVALRMNELQVSKLDTIRRPDETRSAAIRRIITDAWADAMVSFDEQNGSSISDRVNCL